MASVQYPPRAHLHLKTPSMASLASLRTIASSSSISTTTSTSSRLKSSRLGFRRTIASIFSQERNPPTLELRHVPSGPSMIQIVTSASKTPEPLPTKPNPLIPRPITVHHRPEISSSPSERSEPPSPHDSKLNSLSTSLTSVDPEDYIPPPTKILLTPSQYSHFLHLFRRIRRLHSHHGRLSTQFATNVAGLLSEQEKILVRCDQLSGAQRGVLRSRLKVLRKGVGKAFMRMAICGQRGVCRVEALGKLLEGGRSVVVPGRQMWDGKGKGKGKAVDDDDDGNEGLRIVIGYKAVLDALKGLRDGIEAQGRLEKDVRSVLGKVCKDERIPAKVADGVALRRFKGFVSGRVGVLGGIGERITATLAGLENMAAEMGC